ncbi:hypothetical protein ACFFX0_09275 [Citricoccus parietis]|uniref:Uncharacterized protein n=1 Tax=Citricoccus parietis TaxID=592307 RepID=A0ABV5FXH1_9MICC
MRWRQACAPFYERPAPPIARSLHVGTRTGRFDSDRFHEGRGSLSRGEPGTTGGRRPAHRHRGRRRGRRRSPRPASGRPARPSRSRCHRAAARATHPRPNTGPGRSRRWRAPHRSPAGPARRSAR